jgi:anti-sigma regulatory factor (Ser/Thr protein kinase)
MSTEVLPTTNPGYSVSVLEALQNKIVQSTYPSQENVFFDGFYRSADTELAAGGDWYAVFLLPSGKIGFTIGDVGGHGIDAALDASVIREILAAYAYLTEDPGTVLTQVNAYMCHAKLNFATAIYGTIDPTTQQVRYAIAGHPPPVYTQERLTIFLATRKHLMLGVDSQEVYRTLQLAPKTDSTIVLYTDGLIEFDHDILAGERRLLDSVDALEVFGTSGSAYRLVREVLSNAQPVDDLAVLTIHFTDLPSVPPALYHWYWAGRVDTSDTVTSLRHMIIEAVSPHCLNYNMPDIELIIGELLTNVYEHSSGYVSIKLDWDDTSLDIDFSDLGTNIPKTPSKQIFDGFSENGRGLILIKNLCQSFSFTTSHLGTTVIVQMACQSPLDDFHQPETD